MRLLGLAGGWQLRQKARCGTSGGCSDAYLSAGLDVPASSSLSHGASLETQQQVKATLFNVGYVIPTEQFSTIPWALWKYLTSTGRRALGWGQDRELFVCLLGLSVKT